MKSLVVPVVIAAVVGGAAGLFFPSFINLGPKKVAHATILIYRVDNVCRAKVFPEVLQVEKKFDIDWTVANICGDGDMTTPVSIRWIDHPGSAPAIGDDPLESPGSDPKRIRRALKNGVAVGDLFRYQVWRGDQMLADPDVEIVF